MSSAVLGGIFGIFASLYLKNIELETQDSRSKQFVTFFGIPMILYLLAEYLKLSGIVSIMICGLFMARYSVPNVPKSTKAAVFSLYKLLAHNFEIVIFIYLGMGVTGFTVNVW